MITDKIKNALAKANDLGEERKIELIREKVKEQFSHPADEIAILRKAISYLFEIIAMLHAGEIENAEFAEYNAFVERVKAEAKAGIESSN